MPINIGNKKSKLNLGSKKVSRAYLGSTKIYSSGNTVMYYVDEDTVYREEVEEGESCLKPKTFIIPPKKGYLFVGWSLKSGGEVLDSIIMGNEPITLYAVFQDANVMENPDFVTYTPNPPVHSQGIYGFLRIASHAYGKDPTADWAITIKLNGHKKATVKLLPGGINVSAPWDNPIWNTSVVTVNGKVVYNSAYQQTSSVITYTYYEDTTINVQLHPTIRDMDNSASFCYSYLAIESIEISDE